MDPAVAEMVPQSGHPPVLEEGVLAWENTAVGKTQTFIPKMPPSQREPSEHPPGKEHQLPPPGGSHTNASGREATRAELPGWSGGQGSLQARPPASQQVPSWWVRPPQAPLGMWQGLECQV